jgi:hypothetical protein
MTNRANSRADDFVESGPHSLCKLLSNGSNLPKISLFWFLKEKKSHYLPILSAADLDFEFIYHLSPKTEFFVEYFTSKSVIENDHFGP